MFSRNKKSGEFQYLQIAENRKDSGKVKQRLIATIGRMDQLQAKGRVETLIRSLSRFYERTLMILNGQSDVSAEASKIAHPSFLRGCGKKQVSGKPSGMCWLTEGLSLMLSEPFFSKKTPHH